MLRVRWFCRSLCLIASARANNDGTVDTKDLTVISASFGAPFGRLEYNPTADINGGYAGTTGSEWGPVTGIPDGKVDISDLWLASKKFGC